jgi:hypothetical protein
MIPLIKKVDSFPGFPHHCSTPKNGGLLNSLVNQVQVQSEFGMGSGEPSPYGRPYSSNRNLFKKVVIFYFFIFNYSRLILF